MADSGLVIVVSLISPWRKDRERAREIIGADRFVEVFVDTPMEICEARDPKGLYAKARAGDLANFTGVSSSYEVPESPNVLVSGNMPVEKGVRAVIQELNIA